MSDKKVKIIYSMAILAIIIASFITLYIFKSSSIDNDNKVFQFAKEVNFDDEYAYKSDDLAALVSFELVEELVYIDEFNEGKETENNEENDLQLEGENSKMEKVLKANIELYESDKEYYLYELYHSSITENVTVDNGKLYIPTLNGFLGNGYVEVIKDGIAFVKENDDETKGEDKESEKIVLPKVTKDEWDEIISVIKWIHTEKNETLKSDSPDLVDESKKLKKVTEELDEDIIELNNLIDDLNDFSSLVQERINALKALIKDYVEEIYEEGELLEDECENSFNFYCDIISVKEYIEGEYEDVKEKEKLLNKSYKKVKETYQEYDKILNGSNLEPYISYDNDYIQSIEEEVKRSVDKNKTLTSELENILGDFKDKYVK